MKNKDLKVAVIGAGEPQLHKALVMRWVAVTEEKPPVHEWVLLGNREDKWVDRGIRYRDGTYHNGECQVMPTHWCYLPEPPCV